MMGERMQTKQQAIQFSETVSGTLRDGVLVVTLDNPPVNAASVDLRQGLLTALRHFPLTQNVKAVVITGAGKAFVGGADIREFGMPQQQPDLRLVTEQIENSARPVIAAINGAALGGGAEIALASHYRIASPGVKIGLPEVKLGLVPGAGGTQRLARLTGIAAALDLIGTGKIIDAGTALALGMIDEIAEGDLLAAALDIAKRPDRKFRRTSELECPVQTGEEIDAAAKKILARSKGVNAPLQAVRLVRQAGNRSFIDGLADERETFIALRDSPEAAALRHVFFAERAAAKVDGLEGVKARTVKTIGIVGLGLMGAGIATAALDGGFTVVGVDRTEEAATAGRSRIEALLARNLASGRIDASGLEDRKLRLTITSDMSTLGVADLVIEAVFDDLDVKSELFSSLDRIVRPDAILATNTSYLNPDEIAAATLHPERILGLHFFSPANVMRLVEVVRCAKTGPDVLATGMALVRKLGKLPVVTGVTEGFIGNRIFSAYRREAEFLLEDGALPQDVDTAMVAYGFPMGPFAVFDMAGLQIAWARRKRDAANRNPEERYVDIADRLCEAGRFGQKSGRGWYLYRDGQRLVDPEVTGMIIEARRRKQIAAREIGANEIVQRLLAAMVDEGHKLLSENIAARAGDIDLVMINGYGFPAHKGGPLYAAGQDISSN